MKKITPKDSHRAILSTIKAMKYEYILMKAKQARKSKIKGKETATVARARAQWAKNR